VRKEGQGRIRRNKGWAGGDVFGSSVLKDWREITWK
jgi:hypothetical protein